MSFAKRNASHYISSSCVHPLIHPIPVQISRHFLSSLPFFNSVPIPIYLSLFCTHTTCQLVRRIVFLEGASIAKPQNKMDLYSSSVLPNWMNSSFLIENSLCVFSFTELIAVRSPVFASTENSTATKTTTTTNVQAESTT